MLSKLLKSQYVLCKFGLLDVKPLLMKKVDIADYQMYIRSDRTILYSILANIRSKILDCNVSYMP